MIGFMPGFLTWENFLKISHPRLKTPRLLVPRVCGHCTKTDRNLFHGKPGGWQILVELQWNYSTREKDPPVLLQWEILSSSIQLVRKNLKNGEGGRQPQKI